MKVASSVGTLFVLSTALLTAGCGKSSVTNLLTGITAKTFEQNGDVWAEISATLTIGGFQLAALNIPIDDPAKSGVEYGQVTLTPVECSSANCSNGGTLGVSVDLTQAAEVTASSTDLPNGTAFPLTLGSGASLIALPIGSSGAKVYIAFGAGTALVGAAIPFSALDSVGKYANGADIFDSIAFGQVNAYVGIFAGSGKEQTGLGVFADLSKVLSATPLLTVTSDAKVRTASARTASAASPASSIHINASAHSPGNSTLSYKLWQLGNEHPTLRYQ